MLDPWALNNSALKKKIATLLYERRCLDEAACVQVNSKVGAECGTFVWIAESDSHPSQRRTAAESGCAPAAVAEDAVTVEKEKGKKILLYLGRLHPKKGLTNLVNARLVSVSTIRIGCSRSPAGIELGHADELQQLAASLQLGGRILFLGPQHGALKDLRYRQADAFILPSYSEGLPMVVLEAWSYAKPVLMTPACNLPIGFETNAAISIEPDAVSIEQGLRRLFRMPDAERIAMGRTDGA